MDSPVNVKVALLQALLREDGYGLQLIERVKERTKGKLSLRQGSIYPALREMEHDGLVRPYEGEVIPSRGGRPRVYYKITARGKRAANRHLEVASGLFGLP